jgi:hypothetical protein
MHFPSMIPPRVANKIHGATGECMEGKVLRLMQIRNSAWSFELVSKEKMESRRLAFEIERETRRRELEHAKIEVEKNERELKRSARRNCSERSNAIQELKSLLFKRNRRKLQC